MLGESEPYPDVRGGQLRLMWAPRLVSSGPRGKLGTVLITGFPAGMLQCNCYVLAERPGTDAVIVDPGQRVMGQLRRILDENRLTPAAVLLLVCVTVLATVAAAMRLRTVTVTGAE